MTSRLGINVPTANITETPKEYKLELSAPGLERKDFNVEIDNHTLTISAEKEKEKEERMLNIPEESIHSTHLADRSRYQKT